jgi:hypothetical protein
MKGTEDVTAGTPFAGNGANVNLSTATAVTGVFTANTSYTLKWVPTYASTSDYNVADTETIEKTIDFCKKSGGGGGDDDTTDSSSILTLSMVFIALLALLF